MLEEGIKVIRIEPKPGAVIQKVGKEFAVPVLWRLEDNRVVEKLEKADRKKDLAKKLEALPEEPQNELRAKLTPDGRLKGFTCSLFLGIKPTI